MPLPPSGRREEAGSIASPPTREAELPDGALDVTRPGTASCDGLSHGTQVSCMAPHSPLLTDTGAMEMRNLLLSGRRP